jgi:hypothetical protein
MALESGDCAKTDAERLTKIKAIKRIFTTKEPPFLFVHQIYSDGTTVVPDK